MSKTNTTPVKKALPMEMEVKIRPIQNGSSVLADASVTLNGCFAVRDIKVMRGNNGPFVSMPRQKVGSEYRDVCFPCTKEFHQKFRQTVLEAYEQKMAQSQEQAEASGKAQEQSDPGMEMTQY